MNFACIQDCSVCPFYCNDLGRKIYSHIENEVKTVPLPAGLTSSTIEETPAEEEQIEIHENVPAVQDLQYSVETVPEKKGFFKRRAKK